MSAFVVMLVLKMLTYVIVCSAFSDFASLKIAPLYALFALIIDVFFCVALVFEIHTNAQYRKPLKSKTACP